MLSEKQISMLVDIKRQQMLANDPNFNGDVDVPQPLATQKLVPNLFDKKNYITHYRNLKLYLQLGLKITAVHRVLVFDQKPWLKKYIDFNTAKRASASSEFEKNFFNPDLRKYF